MSIVKNIVILGCLLVFTISGFAQASLTPDVFVYKQIDTVKLKMEVYHPNSPHLSQVDFRQ